MAQSWPLPSVQSLSLLIAIFCPSSVFLHLSDPSIPFNYCIDSSIFLPTSISLVPFSALYLSSPFSCLPSDLSPSLLIVLFFFSFQISILILKPPYISPPLPDHSFRLSFSLHPLSPSFPPSLPPLLVPDLHPPCDHPSRVEAICSCRRTKCILAPTTPNHQPGCAYLCTCVPIYLSVCVKVWPHIPRWAPVKNW